jgi:hypothetical protein
MMSPLLLPFYLSRDGHDIELVVFPSVYHIMCALRGV